MVQLYVVFAVIMPPAGPPLPGQDPLFDRMVEEEIRRRAGESLPLNRDNGPSPQFNPHHLQPEVQTINLIYSHVSIFVLTILLFCAEHSQQ